jgi:hypothetical protein
VELPGESVPPKATTNGDGPASSPLLANSIASSSLLIPTSPNDSGSGRIVFAHRQNSTLNYHALRINFLYNLRK